VEYFPPYLKCVAIHYLVKYKILTIAILLMLIDLLLNISICMLLNILNAQHAFL